MPSIRFVGKRIELPANRLVRMGVGVGLIVAGAVFGFLPILGYWMVPLGLVVLSVDFPPIRRWRRRTEVALTRWWNRQVWAQTLVRRVTRLWSKKAA